MTRLATAIFLLLALASDRSPSISPSSSPAATARFAAVDVFVDPHGQKLAAYQVQIIETAGDVTLVGLEGGDAGAFAKAPYYDPRANLAKRIVIAAFSTSSALPTGRTRVATLMVRIAGPVQPRWQATLQVAGSSDGKPIPADVSIAESSERGGPTS